MGPPPSMTCVDVWNQFQLKEQIDQGELREGFKLRPPVREPDKPKKKKKSKSRRKAGKKGAATQDYSVAQEASHNPFANMPRRYQNGPTPNQQSADTWIPNP